MFSYHLSLSARVFFANLLVHPHLKSSIFDILLGCFVSFFFIDWLSRSLNKIQKLSALPCCLHLNTAIIFHIIHYTSFNFKLQSHITHDPVVEN